MKCIISETVRMSLRTLARARVLWPIEKGPRILTYHSVRPKGPGRRSSYVDPADFEAHVRWLLHHGFEVVSLSRIVNTINLSQQLPANWISITFDDGYADNYEFAFPALKRYGIQATVFLISGKVNRDPRFLTSEHMKDMMLHGVEFGAHTVDHVSLCSVPPSEARRQVSDSKAQLEALLNTPVQHFCYPFGHYNMAVEEFVREAGYRSCCTEQAGALSQRRNPWRLFRVGILGTDTLQDFGLKVRGAYDWWINTYMLVQESRRRVLEGLHT